MVCGLPSVSRAVINHKEGESDENKPRYHMLVEGYGLQEVMGLPGVDGRNTISNHVIEVEKTLGIEASRTQIIEQIMYIMQRYGLTIDLRHLMLLADVMTCKGTVLGITRHGISKVICVNPFVMCN